MTCAPVRERRRHLTALIAAVVALCLALTGLTMQSAQAADTGSITGKVFTKAVGGSNVAASSVFIYLSYSATIDGGYDSVDSDPSTPSTNGFSFTGNTYALTGLKAGYYKFEVAGVGDSAYQREYYNDKDSLSGAIPVQVGTGATAVDDMVLEPAGQITGKVTDRAGNPLANASISFEDSERGGGGYANTDANGNFTSAKDPADGFGAGLVRGQYRVSARLDDYANPDGKTYEQRYWQDSATYTAATPVTVTPGATASAINIKLDVAPRMRLTVKDPAGNPLPNTAVGIYVFYDGAWGPYQAGPNDTDADGVYRRTLRIGDRYKFFVNPPQGVAGVKEWYDNAYTEATAKEIKATQYGEVIDFEIRLGDGPPVTGSTPTVSGTAQVGQTLTAAPGTWGPTGVALTYQWLAGGTAIAGATSTTYQPKAADVGKTIAVKVTGTLANHTTTAKTSAATAAVVAAPVPPVVGSTPTVSGTAQVGQTLTATPGTWGPTGVALTYQWLAGGTAIAGATSTTYQPTTTDIGKTIAVKVTGTLANHTTTAKTSAATAAVVAAPVAPAVIAGSIPKISGTPRAGTSLVATPGTWTPSSAKLTYRWFAGGKQISGATARTFTPSNTQAGKSIFVTVTGTLPGSATVTRQSSSTKAVVGRLSTSKVSIKGTAKVGKTLRASTKSWGPKPVTLSYRWYRNGKTISGQKKSSYKLRKADQGKRITVRVTQKKSNYLSADRLSAKTAKVKKK